MASHQVDFVFHGDLPSIIVRSTGIKTRYLMPLYARSNIYVAVPAGSQIKTLGDLKGKTFGISTFGSETDVAISILLKELGLTRSDVSVSQIGGSSQRFGALIAGRIDVAPLIEPAITLAKERGFNPIISSSYLKGNRATLTRFVKAYVAGAYLALADETKAKEVVAQKFKTNDAKVIAATYADFKRLMPRDAAPSLEGAKNVLAQLEAIGTDIGSRNANDYLDLGIIEALKQEGYFVQLERTYPVK